METAVLPHTGIITRGASPFSYCSAITRFPQPRVMMMPIPSKSAPNAMKMPPMSTARSQPTRSAWTWTPRWTSPSASRRILREAGSRARHLAGQLGTACLLALFALRFLAGSVPPLHLALPRLFPFFALSLSLDGLSAFFLLPILGLTADYFAASDMGGFDLEHHLWYPAEVRNGDSVAIRFRILARSLKLMHYLMFMENQSRGVLSSMFECVYAHADLKARRTAPFPAQVAAKIDAFIAANRALSWTAPVSGAMGVQTS